MTIFGKRLSEYVAFSKPFLGLILVVGIVRFVLSFAGVPNSAAKWFSITVVMWIGGLYYAVKIHTSGSAVTNICSQSVSCRASRRR